jgi:translation elongation factor EF-Tu-like GTPase
MGFWARLFGRTEFDSTVTDYVSSAPSGPFRLEVEDVFSITGRGTVVTGTVASGRVRVGDSVGLRRADGSRVELEVTGLEAFQKRMTSAGAGDHIGVLVNGVGSDEIAQGDVLES